MDTVERFTVRQHSRPGDANDAAIKYAADLGAEHGKNAAEWYAENAFGNRRWRDADAAVRRTLQGIEDGDPAVLDTFPHADLSGEWADGLTGPDLVHDANESAGLAPVIDERMADNFDAICDAYETAFSTAVEDEIGRIARAQL